MIIRALQNLGIQAELNGRNDMTVQERKFSGNAFCQRGKNMQRHGTLLVHSNLGIFDRYLNVPKKKLIAKGVKSVRSRVCNLKEFRNDLTIQMLTDSLLHCYLDQYGTFETYSFPKSSLEEIQRLYNKHKSWEWRMGEAPSFDYAFENRFPWGMTQIHISVSNGIMKEVKVYTDSLDVSVSDRISLAFTGRRFSKEEFLQISGEAEGETRISAEFICETLE